MDSPIKKSLYQNVLPFSKPIYGRNFMLIDQFLLWKFSVLNLYHRTIFWNFVIKNFTGPLLGMKPGKNFQSSANIKISLPRVSILFSLH